jgi:Spx/MgsR family transcriptional regulator
VTLQMFGITNCDTVKKARAFLAQHSVEYGFHDFKKLGVPAQRLSTWMKAAGWERLLNRQGNTWRGLDDSIRQRVADADGAQELMLASPSVIKRPVVEWPDGSVTVGFDAKEWAARL